MHSPYLRELLDNLAMGQTSQSGHASQIPQVRILLPLWATARAFRVLLDFVNSHTRETNFFLPLPMDDENSYLANVQNVLWLADFFQILPL